MYIYNIYIYIYILCNYISYTLYIWYNIYIYVYIGEFLFEITNPCGGSCRLPPTRKQPRNLATSAALHRSHFHCHQRLWDDAVDAKPPKWWSNHDFPMLKPCIWDILAVESSIFVYRASILFFHPYVSTFFSEKSVPHNHCFWGRGAILKMLITMKSPQTSIEISQVMIFVMSEQLASWVPSLYREASLEDVQQGQRWLAVTLKGARVDETKRCKVRRPAYHGRSSRFCPTQFGDVYMMFCVCVMIGRLCVLPSY